MAGLIPTSDEDDAAALATAAPAGAASPDDLPGPGLLTGVGTGAGMGVMRGGAKFVQGVNLAVGGTAARAADYVAGGGLSLDVRATYARAADRVAPVTGGPPRMDALQAEADAAKPYTKWQDDVFGQLVKPIDDPISYWTPDARSVGTVGHILGGLTEIALPAMAGGSAGFIGTAEVGTAKDLSDKGVDATTAVATGVATGAAFAAGMHVPILGTNLLTRMASGAAGNLALFGSAAVTQHATLEDAGYDEQAKAFDVWDPQARALDVLMGVVFGAVTHLGARGGTAGKAELDPAAIKADVEALGKQAGYVEPATAPAGAAPAAPVAPAPAAAPSTVPRGTLEQQDAILTAINANRQASSTPMRAATPAGHNAHVEAFDAAMAAVVRGERVDVASLIDPADFHVDQPHPQLESVKTVARQSTKLANLSGNHALVRDAATTAGVDPHLALAIAQIESGVNPNAASPLSTARGIGQFLDSTWAAMGGTGANRFDAPTQARILAEFTAKNTDDLRGVLKREPEPHEVYLAHLLGMGGARKALTAPRDALMVDVMGPTVTNNNGMAGMTVAQAMTKWKGKLERAGAEPIPAREAPAAPVRAYHGTKAEIKEAPQLKGRDLGTHFTVDPVAAEGFARDATATGTPKVLPADLHFEKSLDLPDMGRWEPSAVAAKIDQVAPAADGNPPLAMRVTVEQVRATAVAHEAQPAGFAEAAAKPPAKRTLEEAEMVNNGNRAIDDAGTRAGHDVVRQHLKEQGYDSIKYPSKDGSDSYIALDQAKVTRPGERPAAPRADEPAGAVRESPAPVREAPAPAADVAAADAAAPAAPAAGAEAKPASGLKADYETARQTAEANPDLVIVGENGEPMLARDAIAAMDREIAEADFFSQAFEVAAACALRGGH